jgi:isoquinoline 1-oxidoreductase beta subunit
MSQEIINVSRRDFIKAGLVAGTGLTLGVYLSPVMGKSKPSPVQPFSPNAFVRISSDNIVTVISKHLEMGQGVYTGLATLVAEELDAAWEQIHVESAPADASRYNNLFRGNLQGTGGSTSIANAYTQMRQAGAAARQMLLQAAAKKWQVKIDSITVQDGVVTHAASKRQAKFGELTELAAQQPVPGEVLLKEPAEFRLIGSDKTSRTDRREKINGTAIYTQDIKLPGMLTALVAHSPRFGGKVKSFAAEKAKKIPGVVDVVEIPNGVAVLAKDFWSAKLGRDQLAVEWDESKAFTMGSTEIMQQYQKTAKQPGLIAHTAGNVADSMKKAAKTLTATNEFPYLAHATMEPMNCVVNYTGTNCEVWNGTQSHTIDKQAVAKTLGLKPEQVKINTLFAGGSFGRRANPHSDYVVEAATIAKAIQGKVPVKLVWTREDDMQSGFYRPMYYHTQEAGLDADGKLLAWQHRIVGQSITKGTRFEAFMTKNGIDRTSVEGASNLPYTVPNIQVELHTPENIQVPVQWWRSVGSTHTAFSTETFLDEIAAAAGKDPMKLRRELLQNHPRHLAVLELVAEKSGWGKALPAGKGRGIAVHESFKTFVAEVAEVTVSNGSFTVDRVVIAVDCGVAINPNIIKAQMEGGMGYGLAAALSSKITLKDGMVEQSNFHDYTVLRMDQMPTVEVHIVKSTQPPSGVGEPATPVIAPAVANALYAATGKRCYQLPLSLKT